MKQSASKAWDTFSKTRHVVSVNLCIRQTAVRPSGGPVVLAKFSISIFLQNESRGLIRRETNQNPGSSLLAPL